MSTRLPLSLRYTILLEYDADGPGYVVSVPALPGRCTQGVTVPEAIERAKEAIAEHAAALVQTGEEVPSEDIQALMMVVEVENFPLAGD